jgi:hypothetical protein
MIIGLGYKARSGKDSVADYLVEHHGYCRRAFADSLKEACRAIFDLSDEQLYGSQKEEVDPFWKTTPRDILQRVGTEAMRVGYDPDIWVMSLKKHIQSSNKANWVITDVRFPNEAEAIKEMGGIVVRVDRENRDRISSGYKHPSEISMDKYERWDKALDNNQDLPQLYANVEILLQGIKP